MVDEDQVDSSKDPTLHQIEDPAILSLMAQQSELMSWEKQTQTGLNFHNIEWQQNLTSQRLDHRETRAIPKTTSDSANPTVKSHVLYK